MRLFACLTCWIHAVLFVMKSFMLLCSGTLSPYVCLAPLALSSILQTHPSSPPATFQMYMLLLYISYICKHIHFFLGLALSIHHGLKFDSSPFLMTCNLTWQKWLQAWFGRERLWTWLETQNTQITCLCSSDVSVKMKNSLALSFWLFKKWWGG